MRRPLSVLARTSTALVFTLALACLLNARSPLAWTEASSSSQQAVANSRRPAAPSQPTAGVQRDIVSTEDALGSAGDQLAFADVVLEFECGASGGGDPRAALEPSETLSPFATGIGGSISVAFLDNVLFASGDARADLALIGVFDAVQVEVRAANAGGLRSSDRASLSIDAGGWMSVGEFHGNPVAIDLDRVLPRHLGDALVFDAVRLRDRSGSPSAQLAAAQPALVGGVLALMGAVLPNDVVGREVSVWIQSANDLYQPADAVSRELSVRILSANDAYQPWDVVSRELSVRILSGSDAYAPADVVSREMSVRVLSAADAYQPDDVVSRELSVRILSASDAYQPWDAVSREVSVQVAPPEVQNGATDVVSRELSVHVLGGADLRIASIVAPASGETDEPVAISWLVRNAGNGATTPSWVERIAFSTDGTLAGIVASHDVQVTSALAAGATRTFSAEVPAPHAAGAYFLLARTDATDIVAEEFAVGAETNNTFVADATIAIAQAPRPALEVLAITPPRTPLAGQTIELVWWTRNSGDADAVGPWTERIELGDGVALAGATSLGVVSVNATLAPGAQLQRIAQVVLPASLPADPWLRVCANAGGELLQLPSANPCATAALCANCPSPDVVVAALDAPPSALAGQAMNVTWTARNDGDAEASAPWLDRVALVREADGAVVAQATFAHSAALPASASVPASASIPVPADAEGPHRVRLELDSSNALLERGGETNNTALAANPTDVVPPPQPNLVVSTSSVSATTATTGALVDVAWTTSNSGGAEALAPWQDAVYLTTQPTFSVATAELRATFTQSQTLAAGAAYPAPIARTLVMPQQAGTWRVFVVADRLDDVEEGQHENDNVGLAGTITVENPPRPNLAVSAIVPAPAGPAGSFVQVGWTVTNSGQRGLNTGSGSVENAQWNERVYASSDATIGGDLLLASSVYSDALAPGASIARTRSVPVPALPQGYWIVVELDATNTIVESNEADNAGIASTSSSVTPANLVTSAVAYPASALADASIVVSWRVTNAAVAANAVAPWLDTVYLRRVGGAPQPLGSQVRNATLAAQAQYDTALSVTLPSDASGAYEILVVSDSAGAVVESDELDNTFTGSPLAISQPPRANLIVESLTLPGDDLVSRGFTAAWRLRNSGNAPVSAPFTDRVYAVDTLTGTEHVLGFATTTVPIAPGAALDVTAAATMPPVVGTYRLAVVTDRTNQIPEGVDGGEGDNRSQTAGVFHAETFGVAVATSLVSAPAPAAVPIQGLALTSVRGVPAANVPVDIALDVRGSRRVLRTTTAIDGTFALTFSSLPGEAGHYELRSGPRGQVAPVLNDSFDLHGVALEPAQRALDVFPGFRATSTAFVVRNLGDTTLDGLSVQTSSLPAGLTVDAVLGATTLGSLSLTSLDVDVAADATVAAQTLDVALTLVSTQGASAVGSLRLTIRPPAATIVASRALIDEPMQVPASGGDPIQTLVEVELRNIGAGISQPIEVLAPTVSWITLATAMPLEPLLPGDSTVVTLLLRPRDTDVAPGATVTGSIAVVGGAATSFVPFAFHAFALGAGSIDVRATDEGTYWGFDGQQLPNGPAVGGATVTVREHFMQQVVGTATTGADGRASFAGLPPGYYTIRTQAPGHATNEVTRFVGAGAVVTREAFLPILGVSYTWNVTPTEIEDQYLISVNTTFQTDVPAPVVTISPAYVDLDPLAAASGGQPFQVDYTVKNHGLIRARHMRFTPSAPSGFTAVALTSEIGDLDPGQTVTVPVVITPIAGLGARGCLSGEVKVDWDLVCGIPVLYFSVSSMHASGGCPPPPPPCSICTPGQGGGDGGGGEVTTVIPPPPVTVEISCDCVLSVLGCIPDDCPNLVLACAPTIFHEASGSGVTLSTVIDCVITAAGCAGYSFKYATPYGWISCACGVLRDCFATLPENFPCSIGEIIKLAKDRAVAFASSASSAGGADLPWQGFLGTSPEPLKQLWVTQAERHVMVDAFQWYPYGADEWFDIQDEERELFMAWREELLLALSPTSDLGELLSASEKDALVTLAAPQALTAEVRQRFFSRWNRTAQYWGAGLYTAADLPPGFDDDFIDRSVLAALGRAAGDGLAAVQSEGFAGVQEAMRFAEDALRAAYGGPQQGVCATVEVQIDQTVTLTRRAFRASLALENGSDQLLEAVAVDFHVEAADGTPATHLFHPQVESTSGIIAFDGTGSIPPGITASATWILVPANSAAPTQPVDYRVSGTLQFVRNGAFTLLPLAPIAIRVEPNAQLEFDYFVERDVFSDDPFTTAVEPATPFDLGLRVANRGAGSARQLRVTSAQPRIVRNDSGLLIDFQIVGSQVGAAAATPSLSVDMGDFVAGSVNSARWQLTSSLQGRFIGFEATIQNLSGLDDPEFWVINPLIDVRPMLRAVRADDGGDDGVFDFLDVDPLTPVCPDPLVLQCGLPQRVWTSTGTDEPVDSITNAIVLQVPGDPLRATLTASIDPAHWTYIRAVDPSLGQYRLAGVLRSDGKPIQLGANAWQTSRVLTNGPSVPAPRLHLFDRGGDGNYTLFFDADIVAPAATGWASYSAYGSSGFYTLRVPDSGTWTDSRVGGPLVLRVGFSEPIDPATFQAANVGVIVNTAQRIGRRIPVTTLLTANGAVGEIVLLETLPPSAFVCVTVQGVRDPSGNPLTPAPERLTFWTLVGDVRRDGVVDDQDRQAVIDLLGTTPIDPGNLEHLRADVDRSGAIDALDEAIVISRLGRTRGGISTACSVPVPARGF